MSDSSFIVGMQLMIENNGIIDDGSQDSDYSWIYYSYDFLMQTHVGCSHSQVEFGMHLGTSLSNIAPYVHRYIDIYPTQKSHTPNR